jgi:hypothetical protein
MFLDKFVIKNKKDLCGRYSFQIKFTWYYILTSYFLHIAEHKNQMLLFNISFVWRPCFFSNCDINIKKERKGKASKGWTLLGQMLKNVHNGK